MSERAKRLALIDGRIYIGYAREDVPWLLAEVRDADAAFTALGIADDGRTLAERINAIGAAKAQIEAMMMHDAHRSDARSLDKCLLLAEVLSILEGQPKSLAQRIKERELRALAERGKESHGETMCQQSERQPISSRPGRLGGTPCVSGTRIMVAVLQALRRDGVGILDILRLYPVLTREQVDAALAYELPGDIEPQAGGLGAEVVFIYNTTTQGPCHAVLKSVNGPWSNNRRGFCGKHPCEHGPAPWCAEPDVICSACAPFVEKTASGWRAKT